MQINNGDLLIDKDDKMLFLCCATIEIAEKRVIRSYHKDKLTQFINVKKKIAIFIDQHGVEAMIGLEPLVLDHFVYVLGTTFQDYYDQVNVTTPDYFQVDTDPLAVIIERVLSKAAWREYQSMDHITLKIEKSFHDVRT